MLFTNLLININNIFIIKLLKALFLIY